jgi:dephospho-CoA kinase
MKHVDNGAGRLKKKRGRKPKADKQLYRHMIRLNNKDNEKFLSLFRQSGARSKSRFIADCILNNPIKIVQVNKSAIDFATQLSQFFAQFRAIKTNYNQVFQTLVRNLVEEKARLMMKIIEKPTLDFILMRNQIEDLHTQIREKCLPK